MLAVLGQGGLGRGGLNFDAKVRRESFEPVDLFYAHIGAMDAFAHGLKIAAQIRKDGVLKEMVDQRYSSWEKGIGLRISEGSANFETLEKYMLEKGEISSNVSGRQELFEMVLNRYLR
jgi:xylose isomerase